MSARLHLSLLIASLLLVACRSDPVHYHTLTPLAATAAGAEHLDNELQVERVTVPAQVDRSQIVVRQGANGLVILETDWWGANLADEVQNALTNLLHVQTRGRVKTSLRLEVQRFDLVPGQYALLDSRWRVRADQPSGSAASELSCRSLLQTPAGVDIEDLVLAQQTNLSRLAAIISKASNAAPGHCP